MVGSENEVGGARPDRLMSGVPGLEAVLGGGFREGSVVLVQGEPGTGKTILANQIAFAQAAQGRAAVYVTLLSESHHRIFAHISGLGFFTTEPIAHELFYLSGLGALTQDGLRGLADVIRREVVARAARLVVLDGLVLAREAAGSTMTFLRFLQELQIQAALTEATVLVLDSRSAGECALEQAAADAVIELHGERGGPLPARWLEVRKLRGSTCLPGRHLYRVNGDGFRVYPRLEELHGDEAKDGPASHETVPSGVVGFDETMGGGVPRGGVTIVSGTQGSGRSLWGFHFLCTDPVEPGLLLGFFEGPTRIRSMAAKLLPRLADQIADGTIVIDVPAPARRFADEVADRLLSRIDADGPRRVVIDGLEAVAGLAHDPRAHGYLVTLFAELRAREVTTLVTIDSAAAIAGEAARAADAVIELGGALGGPPVAGDGARAFTLQRRPLLPIAGLYRQGPAGLDVSPPRTAES